MSSYDDSHTDSIVVEGRDEKVWRVWPDGKTVLLNDPHFVQERMNYDEPNPYLRVNWDTPEGVAEGASWKAFESDGRMYRASEFGGYFMLTVIGGVILILMFIAIFGI